MIAAVSRSHDKFARSFRPRLSRLVVWLFLAWGILALRLAYVQLYEGQELRHQALENATRNLRLAPRRGGIFDRKGRPLAINRPELRIGWVPQQLLHPLTSGRQLARALESGPEGQARLILRSSRRPTQPIWVRRAYDARLWARLGELRELEPRLQVELSASRDYPARALACHVVGYLGASDSDSVSESVGKDGLEQQEDELLRGDAGERLDWVDASGSTRKILQETASKAGDDLYLTLDLDLQKAAMTALQATLDRIHEAIGERSAGAIVAVEPETGRIRAMVSLPGYDPSWFNDPRYAPEVRELLKDSSAPLVNRAVSGLYPPASTFKLITSSAAFASGMIPEHARYNCPGAVMIGDIPFNCFVRTGHGSISYEDAISQSCDVVFFELGAQLGVKRLKDWANRFGLGERSGIELPGEASGLVPDVAYKEQLSHGRAHWYSGDDANMGIGQGYLLATPLQMSLVAATIANGGKLMRPTLIDRVVDSTGVEQSRSRIIVRRRLAIAPNDLQRIRTGMEGAVRFGTAARAYRKDLVLAGKTGTVENSPSEGNPRGLNHTWFIGYGPLGGTRPAGHSDLAVAIFLERSGGYGGALAAPVATYLIQTWMSLEKPRVQGVEP